MVLSFFAVFLGVSFRKGLDERLIAYRTAYLTVMMTFFLVGWTVHFWGAAYLWFLFLLGSGVWLLDVRIDDGVRYRLDLSPDRGRTGGERGALLGRSISAGRTRTSRKSLQTRYSCSATSSKTEVRSRLATTPRSASPGSGLMASPLGTRGRSRMRKSCKYGSVQGALSNEHPYRDCYGPAHPDP